MGNNLPKNIVKGTFKRYMLKPGLERMKLDFVGICINRVPECLASILTKFNVKSIDNSTDSLYNIPILKEMMR